MLFVTGYTVDAYSQYTGSAVVAAILRNPILAAFSPLATQSMYDRVGYNSASTIMVIRLALSCVPVMLVIWGEHIRVKESIHGSISDF